MEDLPTHTPIADMIGIAACLLASAFFSGSETALTYMSLTRARHLLDSKPRRYGILQFWLDRKKRILATLLVGNNLVNILCSVLTYRVALLYTGDYAEAISVFGLTLVILVFAEVTPKTLALHHAEKVVVPILRIVWLVDKLLWLVTFPLTRVPELFLVGTRRDEEEPPVTEDEIEFQIRLGHDQQVFEEREQGQLLVSAVEFQAIAVKDVMIPRTDMFGLDVTTPLDDAVRAVIDRGHSRIPIYRDNMDQVLGLLYAKDLLKLMNGAEDENDDSLETLVRTPPFFVPETRKIADLLAEMRHQVQHMAIVVDEFGGTAGLITLEDIIEELVGDIRDEYDIDETMIKRIDPVTWIVDARLPLLDLKDRTGIELPDTGDYESVGGFVVAHYGSIPGRGDVVISPGVRLTVIESDDRHVETLEVKLVSGETPAAAEP
jgi:CBS domain containing-hemolysin-like protein